MKKILLGALLVVGAMAYGQNNQVIVDIENSATASATANIPVEVTGRVVDKSGYNLVVDILSAQSSDGRGFTFRMPDMFTERERVSANGNFEVTIQKDGIPVKFQKDKLKATLKRGTESGDISIDGTTKKVSGTADDVKLEYRLTTNNDGDGTNSTKLSGTISVTAESNTKTGDYSDTGTELIVELSDFNSNTI